MIDVYVRPGSPSAVKAIKDAIPSPRHVNVKIHEVSRKRDFPDRADFVVKTSTSSEPGRLEEFFAAQRGAKYVACLPEAAPWLQSKLTDDSVIMDSMLYRVVAL